MSLSDVGRELDKCTNCGLCLASCPTYVETRREGDSPRGRVFLTARLLAGSSDQVSLGHVAGCTSCDACHVVCPTGVRFGDVRRAVTNVLDMKGAVNDEYVVPR